MVAKLRLGVIGAGSWTVASHLPNFAKRRDEIDFVAVCRKGPELLEKIQDDWGFETASEDYRDVLAAGVDVVLVASPAALHHEHAMAALEAGAHVLCEKPFTVAPADAWDLVEAAERTGRHLLLAYGWNYRPMVREAKRLMDERGIGEVEQVSIHMASVTRELLSNTGSYPDAAPEAVPEESTWTDPAVSGGGYGQAQLTHALGLALWLTSLRGTQVFALMSSALGAPVELHDAISIRFEGGAIGSMAGGSCHLGSGGNKHQLEVRAIGSEGQLHVDVERELLWLYRGTEEDLRPSLEPNAGLYDCDGPPNTLVDLALGREVDSCSPAELGARTVEILDAAYRSAASGALETVRGR
jgi:predicted dehydrogenase